MYDVNIREEAIAKYTSEYLKNRGWHKESITISMLNTTCDYVYTQLHKEFKEHIIIDVAKVLPDIVRSVHKREFRIQTIKDL
jgi:hypothetical protein